MEKLPETLKSELRFGYIVGFVAFAVVLLIVLWPLAYTKGCAIY